MGIFFFFLLGYEKCESRANRSGGGFHTSIPFPTINSKFSLITHRRCKRQTKLWLPSSFPRTALCSLSYQPCQPITNLHYFIIFHNRMVQQKSHFADLIYVAEDTQIFFLVILLTSPFVSSELWILAVDLSLPPFFCLGFIKNLEGFGAYLRAVF